MSYESSYHTEWQNNRVNFVVELYGVDFFNDKRILELAPYNGYIGNRFSQLGAMVHCIEGRKENVENIKVRYPNLSVEVDDLDTPEWRWGNWDIIINFGLYYHLENYHKEHLINCINNCDLMFFESVVYDSENSETYFRNEIGDDQSLSGVGGSPSTSYIENILKGCEVTFTKYSDSKLNGNEHRYDWIDLNSKTLDIWARRFWIVNTGKKL